MTRASLLSVIAAGLLVSSASAHVNSRWQTPAAVKAYALANPLKVKYCVADCVWTYERVSGTFESRSVEVIRARVIGVGASRVIGGVRRYRHFDVTICARNYVDGGILVRARIFWHTWHPAYTEIKIINGRRVTFERPAGTELDDWIYEGSPISRRGC